MVILGFCAAQRINLHRQISYVERLNFARCNLCEMREVNDPPKSLTHQVTGLVEFGTKKKKIYSVVALFRVVHPKISRLERFARFFEVSRPPGGRPSAAFSAVGGPPKKFINYGKMGAIKKCLRVFIYVTSGGQLKPKYKALPRKTTLERNIK